MSSTLRAFAAWGLSFATGVAVAVVIHFMLFRIGIPLKPFIYVVF